MDTEFNWRNCWYPVVFLADLPSDKPYGFSLYGETLVLFRDGSGQLACAQNRCPHRAARLSDGQIIEGKLECLYHGWQFQADGQCVRIPQLSKDKPIPAPACLKLYRVVEVQGMVWVWPGAAEVADEATLPIVPNLAQAHMVCTDYAIDLPYDQSYLIENVIDVAHIHIAHDGIRGGGRRDLALPLEFSVLENSLSGIKCQFRSIGLASEREMTKLNSALVEFVAPNLIHYTSNYQNPELISGLALYSIPLESGRCRLLYRKYSNFYAWRERIKPRWLEHWTQNTILQQDMALIIGQYSEIERSGQSLKDLWLPLKSSDTLVLQYRKWLDNYAVDTPFYRGYTASKRAVHGQTTSAAHDVFTIHTQHCSACLRTYRLTQTIQRALFVMLFAMLPLLVLSGHSQQADWFVVPYGIAGAALWGIEKFKRRFE